MGVVAKAYEFVTDAVPTAADWNANPDALIAELDGQLDEDNVDYSSADGIVTMAQTQTISGTKTFSARATFTSGITLNSDFIYSTGSLGFSLGGTFTWTFTGADVFTSGTSGDLGSGAAGAVIFLGYNSNASVAGAAALKLSAADGTVYQLWVEPDGTLRVGADGTIVTENNDDSHGVIVGTQT